MVYTADAKLALEFVMAAQRLDLGPVVTREGREWRLEARNQDFGVALFLLLEWGDVEAETVDLLRIQEEVDRRAAQAAEPAPCLTAECLAAGTDWPSAQEREWLARI